MGKVHAYLTEAMDRRGAIYLVLLDPQALPAAENAHLASLAAEAGADAILVGGSLLLGGRVGETVRAVKQAADLPVIIFPGNVSFVTPEADAILFLSLVSGRNPQFLIGEHVVAAPLLREAGLEVVPTAYMLVESGQTTSVEFMSGTKPLPRGKPEIAMAHALAAEYLGMKIAFFDAGSGAKEAVPADLVSAVSRYVTIPVMVGGGIRRPEIAGHLVEAGARIVVTGDIVERSGDAGLLRAFADAVHGAAAARGNSKAR
jgi:phosphoglycerol geranylgeranyltransferase